MSTKSATEESDNSPKVYYEGFDIHPPFNNSANDRERWARVLYGVQKDFVGDLQVVSKKAFYEFQIGEIPAEYPRLPRNEADFRVLRMRTTDDGTREEQFVGKVYNIVKDRLGAERVTYWKNKEGGRSRWSDDQIKVMMHDIGRKWSGNVEWSDVKEFNDARKLAEKSDKNPEEDDDGVDTSEDVDMEDMEA